MRVIQGRENSRGVAAERCCGYSTATGAANVFDRRTKCLQRSRAATAPNADTFDYLKDRVGIISYGWAHNSPIFTSRLLKR